MVTKQAQCIFLFCFKYSNKVDLGNCQCPNGESGLPKLKIFFLNVILLFLFYATVVNITFD